MRTFVFIPPSAKSSGGSKVLISMVGHLATLGFDVYAVPREEISADSPLARLPSVAFERLKLNPDDLWLVPEGWPNALLPGLRAGARNVIYCQNWAYLFSALPEGVDLRQFRLSVLAVSHPTAWFISETTGLKSHILRPGIDLDRFFPPAAGARPLGSPWRVAYMPRKNKAVATGIIKAFEARAAFGPGSQVHFTAIEGLEQNKAAELLRRSHVFLSCGFPEGLGLPPLEAMACGCITAGSGGMGGWDYMRQAWEHPFRPWWPMRPEAETPWGGNGFWTADADVMAGVLALERALALCRNGGRAYRSVLEAGLMTAEGYSLGAWKERLAELWRRAGAGEIF